MIDEYLLPQIQDLDMQNFWFQQDGAATRTARETITLRILRVAIPGRLIFRFSYVPWPKQQPNLASLEFFLWVYLKEKLVVIGSIINMN